MNHPDTTNRTVSSSKESYAYRVEYERCSKDNSYDVDIYINNKHVCNSKHSWMGEFLQEKLPQFIKDLSDVLNTNCFPQQLELQYRNGPEFVITVGTQDLVKLMLGTLTWKSLVEDVLRIEPPVPFNEIQLEELAEDEEVLRVETDQEVVGSDGLRVTGYNNLSCFFSELLVVRYNNGNIESPISGKWVSAKSIPGFRQCLNKEWATLDIKTLLKEKKHVTRFYFSYLWNHAPQAPWISRVELQQLLQRLEKEKKEETSWDSETKQHLDLSA